jgi:hypothetical protein
METPETSYKKGRRGFKAQTVFPLDGIVPDGAVAALGKMGGDEKGTQRLVLSTYKREGGGLVSFAMCDVDHDGMTTFAMFQDYSVRVITAPGVRCTEKSVTAQHAEALKRIPEVLELVKLHYAGKGAKQA